MNSTAQDFSVEDFNVYEIKLSITSLFSVQIIIYSDVIDSFIPEILKYEMSVIVSSTEKSWAVLFTPGGFGVNSFNMVLIHNKFSKHNRSKFLEYSTPLNHFL